MSHFFLLSQLLSIAHTIIIIVYFKIGFKPVGFIELATDTDRLEEYRRIAAFNRKCGVDVLEISPDEVKNLFPLCRTDDVLCEI